MSDTNDAMEKLILSGAMEVAGISQETGEFLYNFTPKLQELYPSLFDALIQSMYETLMSLWERGFVDIELQDDETLVYLTEKSQDPVALRELSEHEVLIMENIVRAFEE